MQMAAAAQRLASAEEVFNKLKWHIALNPDDFVVVCEDRLKGTKELSFGEFRPKSGAWVIPMHRVLQFKRISDDLVVWDREKRLDLVCHPALDAPSIYTSESAADGDTADSEDGAGTTGSASAAPSGKAAGPSDGKRGSTSKGESTRDKSSSGGCPFDYLAVMDFEGSCLVYSVLLRT